MNKQRRERLTEVAEQISTLRDELESVQEEEAEYRDNMPENLQGSVRYERADDVCDMLSDAVDGLQDAVDKIMEAAE